MYDANNSLAEVIESLVFLESLEANVWSLKLQRDVPLTRDLKETRKGLKAEDIYKQQTLSMSELGSCSVCTKWVLR